MTTKDGQIDSHVNISQCKQAIKALLTHQLKQEEKAQENELLPGRAQHIWLVVAVKKMHPEKKLKPFKIPLSQPLVDPRSSSVCLITKDPQRQYKDLLESKGIKFIARVVGVEKLKGKFKPFEARRLLLQEHELFLADERVIPLLPALLGKKFFVAKKQPIPVCLTRKDLKGELETAVSSTYMHQNQGTCTSIKIGTLSHTPSQILSNLKLALPAIVEHIKDGWDNVQSFHIKTNNSVSLPIWSCNLDESAGGRWDIPGAVADESESDEGSDDQEDVAEKQSVDKILSRAPEVSKTVKGIDLAPQAKSDKTKGARLGSSDTPQDPPPVSIPKKRKASAALDSTSKSVPDAISANPKPGKPSPNQVSAARPADSSSAKHAKSKSSSLRSTKPAIANESIAATVQTTESLHDETVSLKKAKKSASSQPPSTTASTSLKKDGDLAKPKKKISAISKPSKSTTADNIVRPVSGEDEDDVPDPDRRGDSQKRTQKPSIAELDSTSPAKAKSVSISAADVKQKWRIGKLKKEKVIGHKFKSAKNRLLGKKVAQA